MRIALLSDIHGNLVALEAVLADLAQTSPDSVICLGDVAVTGPQPRQVIARLRQLAWPIVMGNTDAWLLDPQPWNAEDEESRRLLAIEEWSALQMEMGDLEFIRSFQPLVKWTLAAGHNLLCYHGSPRSNTDLITSATGEEELREMLAGHSAAILAGGHSHRQMLRRFQNSLIINPGSVGLPFEIVDGQARNPLWAEYALITSHGEQLAVEFRRVPVDFAALSDAIQNANMPYARWWREYWR